MTAERSDTLPVADEHGELQGVVTAADIEQALNEARQGLTASALVHPAPELRANQPIADAIAALAAGNDDGVPVLAPDRQEPVGWLTHRQLLRAMRS
ncbi:MAG TPA: CBS domain-containing protein [Solirubrobacteraceae bacterium]